MSENLTFPMYNLYINRRKNTIFYQKFFLKKMVQLIYFSDQDTIFQKKKVQKINISSVQLKTVN